MENGLKFGKDYYDELLETIKEIRLSERRLYQKITDLFEATSIDYNKDSEEAYTFFKIVQNKLYRINKLLKKQIVNMKNLELNKINRTYLQWMNCIRNI